MVFDLQLEKDCDRQTGARVTRSVFLADTGREEKRMVRKKTSDPVQLKQSRMRHDILECQLMEFHLNLTSNGEITKLLDRRINNQQLTTNVTE